MPLTAYCKKCARDVPPGDRCPYCHGKLAKSARRVAWCAEHVPVRDWLCWNAAMRLLLPLMGMVLVLVTALELLGGGSLAGVLHSGLVFSLFGLMLIVCALLLLILILQGEDLQDCVVDGKGVHVQQYLPHPTPLKLILRLRSPRLMEQFDPEDGLLLIGQEEILWKDVARVQLWPGKPLLLFYAPSWWMRLALPCTAFTLEDCTVFLQEKLGKRKGVLPPELLAPPPAAPDNVKPEPEPQQLTLEELLAAPEASAAEAAADAPDASAAGAPSPSPDASGADASAEP